MTNEKKEKGQKKPQKPIKRTNRDDFTPSTIRILKDTAGNICSKPDCLIFTSGSKQLHETPFSIGIAAHITAASPGGPRYDLTLNKEQRRASTNGIWLCQNHARLIDVDPTAFPVESLKEWKKKAEQRSNSMVGERSITHSELKDETRKEASLTLERFIRRDQNPIQTPLSDIMRGYEQNLSNLDNRFIVKASINNHVISHIITPAHENVKVQFTIKNTHEIINFNDSIKALMEEGRELTIPSSNFEFKGSQLLETICNTAISGHLVLGTDKKTVKTNIYAIDKNEHEYLISSFESSVISGSKRLIAEGSCMKNFFKTKLNIDFEEKTSNIELTFNNNAWIGTDILKISNFARLHKSINYLHEGHFIIEYEIDEDIIRHHTTDEKFKGNFIDHYIWLITNMNKARKIAEKIKEPIIAHNVKFDENLIDTLDLYTKLISGNFSDAKNTGTICDCAITSNRSDSSLPLQEESGYITYKETEGLPFNLFGHTVIPPRKAITINNGDVSFYCPIKTPEVINLLVTGKNGCTINHYLTDDQWELRAQNNQTFISPNILMHKNL